MSTVRVREISKYGFSRHGTVEELGIEIPALLEVSENRVGPFRIRGPGLYPLDTSPGGTVIPQHMIFEPFGVGSGLEREGKAAVVSDPDQLRGDEELVVVYNAPLLLRRPRELVGLLLGIRKRLGFGPLIYLPGGAPPHLIPILLYLGVDLMDDLSARLHAAYSRRFTPFMVLEGDGSGNREAMEWALRRYVEALDAGRARELVEAYASLSPEGASMLRMADLYHWREFEHVAPARGRIVAASLDSLRRPEVRRWTARLGERYVPPGGRVLLLLPCSARKPYSQSPSHRPIVSLVRGLPAGSVHEVILSSPLPMVPRELETYHPAMHYDSAVSGVYFEDEVNAIHEALELLLSRWEYEKIVAFLPENMSFVKRFYDIVWIPFGRENLGLLRNALEGYEGVRDFRRRVARSQLSFQYGPRLLRTLDELEWRVKGTTIVAGGEVLFRWTGEAWKPTKGGAELLVRANVYNIEIDDFHPRGTVFSVGVTSTTEDFRIGEYVAVHHGGEVRAVAKALSSPLQIRTSKCAAAKTL